MESIFGAGYLSGRQTALAPLAAPRLARRRDPSGSRLWAFAPRRFLGWPSARNPFGVDALRPFLDLYVNYAQTPLLVLAILLPVISLLVRFRRSRGVKRQQLKWFVSAGATRSCCRHVALRGGGAILGAHRKHFVGLPDPGRMHLSCIHGRSAPALPLVGHRSRHKPRARLRYVDRVRLRRAWCPGTGVRPDHTAHAEHRLEFFGFEILV